MKPQTSRHPAHGALAFRSAIIAVVGAATTACKFPPPPDVEFDAPDGPTGDAQIDGGGDGPSVPFFDVAYPSEWRFSVPGPTDGFVLVVNTGSQALGLATFQLRSLSDDHPLAVARVTTPQSLGVVLTPGTAGGALSALSQSLLVSSGVVTEPWVDRNSQLLSIELVNAPPGTYDIAVDLTVAIEDRDAHIPMTIHVVPGPTVYLDPIVARRVRVYR